MKAEQVAAGDGGGLVVWSLVSMSVFGDGLAAPELGVRLRTDSIAMSRRRLFLFTGAFVTLVLLCSIAYLRGRRSYVTITFRNDSSEIIRSVHIRAFSLIPAATDLGAIAPKQAVKIRLLASGYSGYSITPTFTSGRSFTTEEREALGGYAMTERILDTESLLDWDSFSTIYERSFRDRNGWWLLPVFADAAQLDHERLKKPNKARLDNRWGCSVGHACRNYNPPSRLHAHSRPSGASA
jgi:hypothetical protein